MDRRQFVAASGVGVVAAMAGCVGSALEDDDPSTNEDGDDSSDDDSSDRFIEVSASGDAETEPDRAIVTVGVEATAESADAVRDELADGAAALRETFDELDVPEEKVQTDRYAIRERPRQRETPEDVIFQGSHSFEVEIDDVDRVGEVIDAAVEAGADDVGWVNFTLQEETRDELRNDAIDDALANADAEAAHVADNREVDLAGTRSVSTSDVNLQPVRYEMAHEMASDGAATGSSTDVDSGPVTVTATVRVVYDVTG